MDKRSALLTAGGLAASFVAGAAAVSFNWGIGIPQATTPAVGGLTIPLKPVVKHRTVVIHKKAPSPPAGSVVVLTPAAPAQTQAVVTSSGSHSASGSENESGGDD
jgi:hypothetical protein